MRRAKCHELAGDDPVQIPILHTFIILILGIVELFEVEPTQLHGILQSPQTVQYRAFVGARPIASVPESLKFKFLEGPPHCFSSFIVCYHLG